MSFISINDRAGRIHDRASTAGLFAVSEAMFYARNQRQGSSQNSNQLTTRLAVGIIILLLTCIVGLAAIKGFMPAFGGVQIKLGLHPTCSPDHDCWVAAAKVSRSAEIPDLTPPTLRRVQTADVPPAAPADPVATVALHPSPIVSEPYGVLVKPEANWSGPPIPQKPVKSAAASARSTPSIATAHASKKMKTAASQTKVKTAANQPSAKTRVLNN